jgi:hypothetical protein
MMGIGILDLAPARPLQCVHFFFVRAIRDARALGTVRLGTGCDCNNPIRFEIW